MPIRAGTGYSVQTNSFLAGQEAARQAILSGGLDQCDLLLAFATSRQDGEALLQGLRAATGPDALIVGGNTIGALTNSQLGYDGYQVGVAALQLGDIEAHLLSAGPLPDAEQCAGTELGRALSNRSLAPDPSVLLMYDSMNHTGAAPKMNMATPLLAGLTPHLPPGTMLAGIGQCGDTPRDPVVQWEARPGEAGAITGGTAQALVFSGDVRMDTVVMHGCRPAGSYHEVTKSDGPVVLELDGRPALEVIAEMLGPEGDRDVADYRFFVTLGVNKGDRFGPYREEDYANRLCCGVDEERGGLVMFEPDLVPGTQVQLMRRSVDFQYIEERTKSLWESVAGRTPFLALYIDCAGRASAYCGSQGEEAAEVQKCLENRIPLLGVYCGVEIARVGQDLAPLDWSGVLCLFSHSG